MAEQEAKAPDAAKPDSAAKAESAPQTGDTPKPGHVSPRGGFYIGLLVGLGIALLACMYQAKQFSKVKKAMGGVRDAALKDAAAAKGEAAAGRMQLKDLGAKVAK